MRFVSALVGGLAITLLASAADAAGPYDGTYVGTSANFTGTTSGRGKGDVCVPFKAPWPLTIANGHAQGKWGTSELQGDVDASGKLVMHSGTDGRFEGQIDASGALKGNFMGYCIYALAWQRKG